MSWFDWWLLVEGALLFICMLWFLWAVLRDWEIGVLLPIWACFCGTLCWVGVGLVVSFVHDHVSMHVHLS